MFREEVVFFGAKEDNYIGIRDVMRRAVLDAFNNPISNVETKDCECRVRKDQVIEAQDFRVGFHFPDIFSGAHYSFFV